jgi:DNA invertase Pin-like site-specific DNA recombinase
MSAKVSQSHLNRRAVIYIRQSTLIQVLEHRESTQRQYDLAELANKLGWDSAQVLILDEDLGKSGQSADNRSGFQRLVAEVSLGKVGAIFSLEVSRLARSSADWHRLLDLCALSDTLIFDDDGAYDPNDFNDRLVLGLKGTMSDAERHMMRLRLLGGQRHKANKGELGFPPPTGYVFEGKTLAFDPDEQVQKAIQLLFARFRLDQSAGAVVRYFRHHGLLFPARHAHKEGPAEIRWQKLTRIRALSVLRSPTYAGAYAWGRRRERAVLQGGQKRKQREILASRESWHTLRLDNHPAYIPWPEYVSNLQRLEENSPTKQGQHGHGAVRHGEALLQGLVLCGRCGRRMRVVYREKGQPVYECSQQEYDTRRCWATAARRIDEKVAFAFLASMTPSELELSLAVLKEVEQQAAKLDEQWKLRLERARYEAARAERQYQVVEPENRIVARTLETRWNQKLQELLLVEREYEETRRVHKLDLTEEDKRTIRALSKDLPCVWNAATTTAAERKQLLRLVIQDIVLLPLETPQRSTQIRILWKTGATSEVCAERPNKGESGLTPPEVVAVIREQVVQGKSNHQIAAELNRRKLKTRLGRSYTWHAVNHIRFSRGIAGYRQKGVPQQLTAECDDKGRYSIRGLCARYQVSHHRVRYWIKRGLLKPQQDFPAAPFWFELTADAEARITEALRTGYGSTRLPKANRPPIPKPT